MTEELIREKATLSLDSLELISKALTPARAGQLKEKAMVSFDRNGHDTDVDLVVEYNGESNQYTVTWQGKVTAHMKNNVYVEVTRCAEDGACAIAIALVPQITDWIIESESPIGTSIDYYLAHKSSLGDDTLIFNNTEARLEVSGIAAETEGNSVKNRLREKAQRLKPEKRQDEDAYLPDLIVIVEFSRPWTLVEKYDHRA